jgi:drug/metabolite transporter (DMT)-like permease
MSWLILSILSATGIFLCFGLFGRWKVNNKLAIAVNYSLASIGGYILSPLPKESWQNPWMLISIFIGVAFVYLFYKMADLTQKGGMSLGTISSQMSLVIPVLLAPFLYSESLGLWRIVGILFGLGAIYLLVKRTETNSFDSNSQTSLWKDSLIVFIGTGLCTALIKFSRFHFVTDEMEIGFVSVIFGVSAISSWWVTIQSGMPTGKLFRKSFIAGIVLGIPNLGSLVFLIKALATPGLESTIVFPLNNIGIVLLSSLIGWLLFKERLGRMGAWGIAFAISAVLLISL